jgi:hypothetical protein
LNHFFGNHMLIFNYAAKKVFLAIKYFHFSKLDKKNVQFSFFKKTFPKKFQNRCYMCRTCFLAVLTATPSLCSISPLSGTQYIFPKILKEAHFLYQPLHFWQCS